MTRIYVTLSNAIELARDILLIVCCALFVCDRWPDPESVVDSQSYDADGVVVLALGRQEFTIAPNIAREIAIGLIESAESVEGGIE